MAKPTIKSDGRIITVRVPISIRKRGGRKVVLAPDGAQEDIVLYQRRMDSAMVKAIARAYRWRQMLESGACSTIGEIAAAEQINETYVGRVLRLSLLAPEVIEIILAGRQPPDMGVATLMRPIPVIWKEQRDIYQVKSPRPPHSCSEGSSGIKGQRAKHHR
jgi:hypothetical protein